MDEATKDLKFMMGVVLIFVAILFIIVAETAYGGGTYAMLLCMIFLAYCVGRYGWKGQRDGKDRKDHPSKCPRCGGIVRDVEDDGVYAAKCESCPYKITHWGKGVT